MGKTKIKTIDDSAPVEEKAKPAEQSSRASRTKKKESEKVNPNPELLAKEKAEEEASNVIASKAKQSSEEIATSFLDKLETPRNDIKKEKTSKRAQTQGEPKYRSKKYQEASEKVEKSKRYPIDEAINLTKQVKYSKFDGSLEIHINTSQKNLRGLVSLPFASGKQLKVLAFGKGAEDSGADMVGDDTKLQEIMKGKIDFDALVTTAEWMPKLARAAKVLGPKGLMPSPKNGTITEDLKKAVAELQSGKVEYKTQKDSQVIHLSVGNISQPQEELSQNIKVLLANIGKGKIKGVTIAPSMGPGVKLDTSSI